MRQSTSKGSSDLNSNSFKVVKRSQKNAQTDKGYQELWNDFISGCESSFAMIYQQNFMDLHKYGLGLCNEREVVKDCIHDLFVDLWNKREQLKPVNNIKSYLLVALKRRLINYFNRSKKTSSGMSFEDDVRLISISRERELIDQQVVKEKRKRVLAALNLLTERQQKALHLKFYDNCTNEEIAGKLSINIESTYNLISKAVKRLRSYLT